MKAFFFMAVLMVSFTTMANDKGCDLSSNDRAVRELNDRFDNAQMRGEDHLIELIRLERARNSLVAICVENDLTSNLSKSDLNAAKNHVKEELQVKVAELNESIRISIENDRIGMATELMMERDIAILDAKNLIAKIEKLIAELK